MKNSEIHKNFPHAELRDFLSEAIQKNIKEETRLSNEFNGISYNGYSLDTSILSIENELLHLAKRLKIRKERRAILSIIEMQNWKEFDVSDETERDNDNRWMSFIGNEEEYHDLMAKFLNH